MSDSRRGSSLLLAMLSLGAALAWAGSLPADEAATGSVNAIRLGHGTSSRWRFGVEITAADGPVTGVVATLPVPMDWPEQKVRIVESDITPRTKVSYRVIDGAVKQMVVSIPKLAQGDEARAVVTFEIEKWWIEEPESTAGLRVPKASRELAKYLKPGPYVESNDPKIRSLAVEAAGDDAEPWQQVHAMFTWIRGNVKYKFAEAIKPAVEALNDGEGDCEELSSLFIAFCRVQKIPARAVWVPGHTYPEFCLDDANGTPHWYPCQAAGEAPDFGRMPEDRPILQKGDNLKIPEERTPQRYAKQTLRAKNAAADPAVRFVMEPLLAAPPAGTSLPE
jgi:hypothetical protein